MYMNNEFPFFLYFIISCGMALLDWIHLPWNILYYTIQYYKNIMIILFSLYRIMVRSNIWHFMLFTIQKWKQCRQRVATSWPGLFTFRYIMPCTPMFLFCNLIFLRVFQVLIPFFLMFFLSLGRLWSSFPILLPSHTVCLFIFCTAIFWTGSNVHLPRRQRKCLTVLWKSFESLP